MAPTNRFLDYEIVLLLAKYGEKPVLSALATKLNLSPEEVDLQLRAVPRHKQRARPKGESSRADILSRLAADYPAKADLLRKLHGRYVNHTFLPEMRQVRRLFAERNRALGSAKSRAEALPKLLKLLAEFDVAELETMCEAPPDGMFSSLGLISDEILHRNR